VCHYAGAHYFFDKTSRCELARDTIGRLASVQHAGFAIDPNGPSTHHPIH
jgi:hypothetical protein